tara:strand:+ start:5499 stop:5729 length:231 start_codon:yes stop_codon:yes gene_type:complete
MNAEELKEIGIKLFGSGWQTHFAHSLGITPQHFRRYVSSKTKIPESKLYQIQMMYFLYKHNLWLDFQAYLIDKKYK